MVERTNRFIICLCPVCRHAADKGEYTFIDKDEEELYVEFKNGGGVFHPKIRYHIHDWVCEHRNRCLLVRDYVKNDLGEMKALQREDFTNDRNLLL